MPFLPALGKSEDTVDWNQAQCIAFATISYAVAIGFVAGIILALKNFHCFVKGERESPIRHPMFLFYLWTILDFAANAIWLVLSVLA